MSELKLTCQDCGTVNDFSQYANFNPQGASCRKCGKYIPTPNWKSRIPVAEVTK